MTTRQSIVLVAVIVLIAAGVLTTVNLRVANEHQARGRSLAAQEQDPCACTECALPSSATIEAGKPPKIPAKSGRPCIAAFVSKKAKSYVEADKVLSTLSPRLKGNVDFVRINTDAFPSQAQRWRLRMVPTLVFLDKNGKEAARIEGMFTQKEILSQLEHNHIPVD